MIVLIDNYDSFTFNLYQVLGELEREVVVFKNDEISVSKVQELAPSHIVISPGPGIPEKAGICIELIQTFSGKIPILGVCLGHQAIGVAFGAKLKKAPQLFHGKTSMISHDSSLLFQDIPSPLSVMRYHSWMIDLETLPPFLRIHAKTVDDLPMALSHENHPTFGVQFHPESILTPWGKRLVANFLNETLL